MAFKSLREYVNALEDLGQVRVIEGVDPDLELGGIAELVWEQEGPVSLFDSMKGYPKGYRVVTNLMDTRDRCALALGMPPDASRDDFLQRWKEVLIDWKPVPPREVSESEAPVFQNRMVGDEVDITLFGEQIEIAGVGAAAGIDQEDQVAMLPGLR